MVITIAVTVTVTVTIVGVIAAPVTAPVAAPAVTAPAPVATPAITVTTPAPSITIVRIVTAAIEPWRAITKSTATINIYANAGSIVAPSAITRIVIFGIVIIG